MFVLDASVAAAWFFPDEVAEYSERVLSRLQQEEALVPDVWPLEMANVLVMAERRQRITEAQSAHLTQFLQSLPILVADGMWMDRMTAVVNVARQHMLTAYDASYVELAMRQGLALATQDQHMRHAAERVGLAILT